MQFMLLMGSMVRAIAHGRALEDWLDKGLARKKYQAVRIPSFISADPEFQRPEGHPLQQGNPEPNDDARNEPNGAASIATGSSSASSQSGYSQLQPAGSNYWDLPEESLMLDGTLYNVLRMAIKGSKVVLLDCIKWPSYVCYVCAICALYKHCDISWTDHIVRAFDSMDKLSYNGDAHQWQADAMSSIRELFDSGASMMHYSLCRILRSFNGKLKTIQYRIAEDMNGQEINDKTNIYDMVQKYATDIASVADSKSLVNLANDDDNAGNINEVNAQSICTWCKHFGHKESECRKKAADVQKYGANAKPPATANKWCHKCKTKGHMTKDMQLQLQLQAQQMQLQL